MTAESVRAMLRADLDLTRGESVVLTQRHADDPFSGSWMGSLSTQLPWLLLSFGLVLAAVSSSCDAEAPSQPRAVGMEEVEGSDPAEVMAAYLNELSEVLESHLDNPSEGISALRATMEKHREEVEAAAAHLEQLSLTLSPEAQREYQEKHDPLLGEALKRFARAQQEFRSRASSAESVELSEVLNALESQ